MENYIKNIKMGWVRDYPDLRDYTVNQNTVANKVETLGQTNSVKSMLKKTGVINNVKVKLPSKISLKKWCSSVEDQHPLNSCTAQAGVGLIEYFENKAFGKYIDASKLFLYKTTRNLMETKGDNGALLRTTMAAMSLFGVPPEKYWPYEPSQFDEEPTAFSYAFAQNLQAVQYYRLDPPGISRKKLLLQIKKHLTSGLPSMFGFTVYNSISQADLNGSIPFPTPQDRDLGGHAVMAIGYDDDKKITNLNQNGKNTIGAILIKNSWGQTWGDSGYGWLPYDYIMHGLAVDWWSLLKKEWIDTGVFHL